MNEESMEKEVRRGVRFNKIALAVLAVLAVVGVWALLSWFSRPLDDSITPDGLAENLTDGALGKTGGVYYVLDDGSGLVDALRVLKGVEGISMVYFSEKDVVRHRLVQAIIKAYDKAQAARSKR